MSVTSSDHTAQEKQNYIREVREMIQALEQKTEEERSQLGKKLKSELKDEMTKIQSKKHQLTQSLRADCKNKYEFEEMKADAHFQEIKARKQ